MQLSERVFFARVDTRSVVLDLGRDRFFAFNAPMTRATLRLLEGGNQTAGPETRAARKRLEAIGITLEARADAGEIPAPAARTLWPSLRDDGESGGDWRPRRDVIAILLEAATRLRFAAFDQTLGWVGRRLAVPSTPRGAAIDALDAFVASRPWFPLKPVCRLDAIALTLVLARAGFDPRLVFGVRLDPFHAHCWVEIEGAVANEACEDVAQYTPIMVVGGDARA